MDAALTPLTPLAHPKPVPPPASALSSAAEGDSHPPTHRTPTPKGAFESLVTRGDGTHHIRRPSTPGSKPSLMFNTPSVTLPDANTSVVSNIVPPSPKNPQTDSMTAANGAANETDGLKAAKARLDSQFKVSTAKLTDIVQHMIKELDRGLEEDGRTLKCLPSYVNEMPDGHEKGTFIALDMGGTNFRICEIGLNRDPAHPVTLRQQSFSLSNAIKNGSGEELFDFMASALGTFLNQTGVVAKPGVPPPVYQIGFTFSYPSMQVGIANAILLQWTKGLNCSGVVGQDVGKMFQEALDRKNIKNARVAAIVNDTVGTLVGHAFVNPKTMVGVICGTGSNACYWEDIDNVKKWTGPRPKSGKMIINIEWGAFDNEKQVLPLTSYDETLDSASINPGMQIFEKTIGGMYLGEVARLVAVDLAAKGELFVPEEGTQRQSGGGCPDAFLEQWRLDTGHLAQMEEDETPDLAEVKTLLRKEFKVPDNVNTLATRQVLRHIANLVSTRAAAFTATAIAAILVKQGFRERLVDARTTVAIDGSVFEKYPHFKERMMHTFRKVLGGFGDSVVVELGKDGSGVGAGVIAALVAKGMQ